MPATTTHACREARRSAVEILRLVSANCLCNLGEVFADDCCDRADDYARALKARDLGYWEADPCLSTLITGKGLALLETASPPGGWALPRPWEIMPKKCRHRG